jgi:transcriptional regulator with XRE-family HTH domain
MLAQRLEISQPALNRYEHAECVIPDSVILKLANYFDVSADYLLGRTDNPQGMLYRANPSIFEENKDVREFIEMCFDPESKANERLKSMLYEMMTNGEGDK